MIKLAAHPANSGDLPKQIGAVRLRETQRDPSYWIAPFPGHLESLSKVLGGTSGVEFPAPGHVTQAGDIRCIWAGYGEALLQGTRPDASVLAHAAVIDNSDAWAVIEVSGVGAAEALARLVPIDLKPSVFPPGRSARSLCGHLSAIIVACAENTYEVIAFRSATKTLVHDLERAARGIAARLG